MPLNFDLLAEAGVTNEALRKMFSAEYRDNVDDPKEAKEIDRLVTCRRRIENLIESRITEQMAFAMRNFHLYSAADLAWDSTPISKADIPLVLYAQRRITAHQCLQQLVNADRTMGTHCASTYVTRDQPNGQFTIRAPRLSDVNLNLIRSIVTRRVAAQANRFSNLWPFFKYEPRATSTSAKLRSDLLSQRMDIMADQYGYRALHTQIVRDMFLYGRATIFPQCAWSREVEWIATEEKMDAETKTPRAARIKREGIPFILPHASRTFFDQRYPAASINTDSGCEYFGYWDVVRYGELRDNPDIFNQSHIAYSHKVGDWLQEWSSYFNQYYANVISPTDPRFANFTAQNERSANLGIYNANMDDAAVFLTHYFFKAAPNQIGVGDYPYPIWFHFTVANFRTVIHAEILPSRAGAVFTYNESDQRLMNLSLAMELMPIQEQLNNLTVQLLEAAKRDLFTVAILNDDIFPDNDEGQKAKEEFKSLMKSERFYADPNTLVVSFRKLRDLGIDVSADNIFKIVRTSDNRSTEEIFRSIDLLFRQAERMVVLSPQEQGQVAPREVSATEVQVVAASTEAVYNFISDGIDEGRSAWKMILYESMVSLGADDVELPVVNRYAVADIINAGFIPVDSDGIQFIQPSFMGRSFRYMLRGPSGQLAGEYIFTTRDGAERSSNPQSAQLLTQLYSQTVNSPVGQVLPMEWHVGMIREIFRLSGAGQDFNFDLPPGMAQQSLASMGAPGPGQAPPENPSSIVPMGGAPAGPASIAAPEAGGMATM